MYQKESNMKRHRAPPRATVRSELLLLPFLYYKYTDNILNTKGIRNIFTTIIDIYICLKTML